MRGDSWKWAGGGPTNNRTDDCSKQITVRPANIFTDTGWLFPDSSLEVYKGSTHSKKNRNSKF